MAAQRDKIKKVVSALARLEFSKEEIQKNWNHFLALLDMTHSQFVNGVLDALDDPNEDFGLSQDELVRFSERVPVEPIKKAMQKKLSLLRQPGLGEQATASFTSTANVAQYPVPLGVMRRRLGYDKKKKKKK